MNLFCLSGNCGNLLKSTEFVKISCLKTAFLQLAPTAASVQIFIISTAQKIFFILLMTDLTAESFFLSILTDAGHTILQQRKNWLQDSIMMPAGLFHFFGKGMPPWLRSTTGTAMLISRILSSFCLQLATVTVLNILPEDFPEKLCVSVEPCRTADCGAWLFFRKKSAY